MKACGDDCYVWRASAGPGRRAPAALRPAVFLDRDGTINAAPPPGGYIRDGRGLRLLPGAARAIGEINRRGLLAVVVTNQRWLSSMSAAKARFRAVDAHLRALLGRESAYLDACYACPHELGVCDGRKPAPGMLLRAAEDLDLDLRQSTVIGDSETDMQAGRAAGVRSRLLVDSDRRERGASAAVGAFPSLLEAVRWAL